MAPELYGNNEKASISGYAVDMWSLGEIAFQMLTKKPTFPQLFNLIKYVEGVQPFPNSTLTQFRVSDYGKSFISSTMLPIPNDRLNSEDAWNHDWIKPWKSSLPVVQGVESTRYFTLSTIFSHLYLIGSRLVGTVTSQLFPTSNGLMINSLRGVPT
jgi:serine/threonine protein kinase